ncbi:MAG: ACT domain-containing protein, partial [Muribaculaceae bacterium]|nr:ACT domain-containing protein [Muribaculaceae bacterium]
ILALIEKQKLVSEGAGATAVAAAMYGHLPIDGKRVVCLVSGGNIDVNILNRVITRGLAQNGRICSFELEVDDKPGALSRVLQIVADNGGNILSINHERVSGARQVNSCVIHLELETLNADHIGRIREAFLQAGYRL